ncbi:MATE family efflux transporter [Noviherbaspirillum sedimenti]|uniref:Multidrug-efflux transporter n=1 Tax=Noviherbaspirillum sedimenti TaxID=2320865 RepID=A0A3A3G7V6_9BURK|nr:MATE family efflux transporter [Noviherbaspirillum sedimenti]RJG04061.1 MATE family efflux transporter [Noviherbaspirillum sedimenti]
MNQEARRPAAQIAALAWPILVGQLAVIANGVMDTAMTARYSATDLAALSIAVSVYVSVFVSANGVLYALAPIVGQLYGARRFEAIGAEIRQGLWLTVFLTVAGCLILLFPQPLLALAQASPELNAKASSYLQILALALPASLGFRIYGAFNNAIARPRAVMLIQLAALLLKVPLNAWFIFGGLGLPALGGPGCALATAVTAWLSLAAGWTILRYSPSYRVFNLFGAGFSAPRWQAQRTLLRLGIPMGLSYLIEVSAFTFMALFIARLGETAVAGHQVTANFVTVLYMLPLSIASASGTLVAHALGARDRAAAQRLGTAGIRLAAGIAAGAGVAVWLGRDAIVRAYTPDPSIIASALPLYAFVGVYIFFDALQVSAAYILRAYKITLVPTIIYALMLWGVGLGGGYLLGFDLLGLAPRLPTGAAGFWLGNTASVLLAAVFLLWHLRSVQHKMR